MQLLLLEDEEDLVRIFERVIKSRHGLITLESVGEFEAWITNYATPPDAFIMDAKLRLGTPPVGFEPKSDRRVPFYCVTLVRAIPSLDAVPIILFTGLEKSEVIACLGEFGIGSYIHKNAEYEEVKATIEKIVQDLEMASKPREIL